MRKEIARCSNVGGASDLVALWRDDLNWRDDTRGEVKVATAVDCGAFRGYHCCELMLVVRDETVLQLACGVAHSQ